MASNRKVGVDLVIWVAWKRESRRWFRQYFSASVKPREELSHFVVANSELPANLVSIEDFSNFSHY